MSNTVVSESAKQYGTAKRLFNMLNLIVSISILLGFLCNFVLIWGIPHSMGSIYNYLNRTHRGLVLIYLMAFIGVTYFLMRALLEVSHPEGEYLVFLIFGSLICRVLATLSVGTSHFLYKLASISTILFSQCWIVSHNPRLEWIWLPWIVGWFMAWLTKHHALQVLLSERYFFWIEFVTILQLYCAIVKSL